MALTGFQRALLRVLARNRSPNSVFAGGATLNRGRARWSDDLDIEHTTTDAVRAAYLADRDALSANGYAVEELRLAKGIAHARVSAAGSVTLVDWTQDTAWRFFPAIADREFGWRLHDLDLAVNKVLAAAGRREPRDLHDLVALIRDGVPLSALAWAGCAKDPGLTPSLILDECVHNSRYDPDELRAAIATSAPVDPAAMTTTFRMAVRGARDLFETLPLDQAGHLYLDADGRCVAPDPAGVAAGTVALHAATLNGAWPTPLDDPPAEEEPDEDEPDESPTP